MNDYYPDPSLYNKTDFHQSAFRIKQLLRRRGWNDVVPNNGDVGNFMPKALFKKWQSYLERQNLIKKRNGGKEFERFVAQIICQKYCNPSVYSNIIDDLPPGGDYDVLTEGPSETLFYIETKTSIKKQSISIPELWNFMVREAQLAADMSIFLFDTNFDLEENLLLKFEILYSLAKHIRGNINKPELIDLAGWKERMTNANLERLYGGEKGVYYLYWPVVVIAGGDGLYKNIGRAFWLYYAGIRYVNPYLPFRPNDTRQVFADLPNWRNLPKHVQNGVKNISDYIKSARERDVKNPDLRKQ